MSDSAKDIINDIVSETIRDAKDTADAFWADLSTTQRDEARTALRRLAENNLDALRFPAQAAQYHTNAAHNMNTLLNLAAANKIHARTTARAVVNRVFERLIDKAFEAIDLLL